MVADYCDANVTVSTCALSYLSRVPSFFTPLIEHEKMPVRKNNVLVTYLRYLRVPKYVISVLIRLVMSFLILKSFRESETHFKTGDPMCIGMLNRELPDEGV